MDQTIGSALLIMLIGMITVFAILSIVVLSGRLIINIVNKLTPEPKPQNSLMPEHLAVITSVVNDLTDGQAKHIKVNKV